MSIIVAAKPARKFLVNLLQKLRLCFLLTAGSRASHTDDVAKPLILDRAVMRARPARLLIPEVI
jgi:hypothetical protein